MSLKVYEASAGSGKTFQLALEYIALALSSDSPKNFTNILAVTFTNKATAEMKDRILEQLYNLAHGGLDTNFLNAIVAHTGLSAKVLQQRAFKTLQEIIHDYDHFRVETIDSFFQSLLSNLAHELKLAKGFNIDLNLDEVVSNAVDRLLLSINYHAANNNSKNKQTVNRVSQLIVDYMEEQIQNDKGWKIGNELKSFTKENLFNEVYLQAEEVLDIQLKDTQALNSFKRLLRKELDQYKEKCKNKALQVLQVLENPIGSSDPKNLKGYNKIITCCRQLIKGDLYEPDYPQGFKDSKNFLKKELQSNPDYLALAKTVHAGLNSMEEERNKIAQQANTYELLLSNLGPLCLLSEIGKEIELINTENGTFMLAKTPDFFSKMVQKEDSSFVFERAGTTFKHILIDEFQDTSQMQWVNFKRLLIENLAEGDECMLVGDVKQSIYRWRGGDWEILGNIKESMKHLCHVDIHTLDTNYRSCKDVVEFNNRFFEHSTAFLDELNKKDQLEPQSKDGENKGTLSKIYANVSQQVKKNAGPGYVRLYIEDSTQVTPEEIMDDVYQQIVALRALKVPYDQIGILVRKKKEATAFINYFAQAYPEIPLTSDEAFRLSASPAVNLLVYALKLITDVNDKMAYEVCLQHATALQLDSAYLTTCLQKLCNEADKWLNTPLVEVCQQLVLLFGLPQAENNGNGQSVYLFSFFDKLIEYLEDHPSDLSAFTTYWDEVLSGKSIAINIKDSIFIMTVHASKGLERHTILIPFCNWELESDHPDDIMWCGAPSTKDIDPYIPIVPIKTYASKKVKESMFYPYYYHEHLMQRIDSFNELYVAFTRARNNLLVWSTPKRNRPLTVFMLLNNFVNPSANNNSTETKKRKKTSSAGAVIQTFGQLLPFIEKSTSESNQPKSDACNPLVIKDAGKIEVKFNNWLTDHMVFKQSHLSKAFIDELNETDDKQTNNRKLRQHFIDQGNLLHQLFSLIRHADELDAALYSLTQQGLICNREQEAEIRELISKRLTNPQVKLWFNYPGRIYTECNLLKRNSNCEVGKHKVQTLRPDRVMINENEAIVVDYKFGKPNDKYITQVKEYMECLYHMGYTHVKGYLWFVFSNQICEVE